VAVFVFISPLSREGRGDAVIKNRCKLIAGLYNLYRKLPVLLNRTSPLPSLERARERGKKCSQGRNVLSTIQIIPQFPHLPPNG
jgi:hypothetical protein